MNIQKSKSYCDIPYFNFITSSFNIINMAQLCGYCLCYRLLSLGNVDPWYRQTVDSGDRDSSIMLRFNLVNLRFLPTTNLRKLVLSVHLCFDLVTLTHVLFLSLYYLPRTCQMLLSIVDTFESRINGPIKNVVANVYKFTTNENMRSK